MIAPRRIGVRIAGAVACLAGLLLAAALPRAEAEQEITVAWSTEERTLADGRTYWVRAPECAPADAPDCVAFLGKPRAVIVWLHGAYGREDADAARATLELLRSWSPGTIFVYGISQDASRVWDATTCCAVAPVDDVGYLERVIDDVGAHWTIDRARVGAAGASNGGMLAERAACERPDLIAAASSLAGTFGGACDVGTSRVAQWHGSEDEVVPINGGTLWFNGQRRTVAPASSLAQRMARGSTFELRVRPDFGHHLPLADMHASVMWVVGHVSP